MRIILQRKERKGKERKGKERKGKERKGKERKESTFSSSFNGYFIFGSLGVPSIKRLQQNCCFGFPFLEEFTQLLHFFFLGFFINTLGYK